MIKNLRNKKGFTQDELANIILCDRSYISKLENHPYDHNLTLDAMYYISHALEANYLEIVAYFAKNRMGFIGNK